MLTRDRVRFGSGAPTGVSTGPTDTEVAFGDFDITDDLIVRGVNGVTTPQTTFKWRSDLPSDTVFELLGDYNLDGTVDSLSDYTAWRNRLGSTTSLVADGDDDGIVDADDNLIRNANFGNTFAISNVTV
ncbi:hypothetical protein NG895_14585 [Aeoliella sp. ICT_H6.2]|uniref:Uncharacterized protein n=1 Tax=Aeoliella straminimaris TaxID=2954799 RepID=A0A9X2FA63_9BACT|nr:hypothetical protein [Aeoliella straminimaris]MCO6045135.1 hypothetical protein [Aeoliella straminimaris]